MRALQISRIAFALLVACGRPAAVPAPVPATPIPATPTPAVVPARRALQFSYRPARLTARLSAASVVVEAGVDSQRVQSETSLSLDITEDAGRLRLAGIVDSLRVEPSRLATAGTGFTRLRLPVAFRGELSPGGRFAFRVDADSAGGCWSEAHAVIDPVASLLPRMPARVAVGERWNDSTETRSCRAGIPVVAREVRSFVLDSLTNEGTAVVSYTGQVEARGERGVAPAGAVTYASRGELRGRLTLDVSRGVVRVDERDGVHRIAVTVAGRGRELVQRTSWRADVTPAP